MIDSEKAIEVYARDFWTCQRCGKTGIGLSIAHRIKSGKGTEEYIRKYVLSKYNIELTKKQIDDIIDHSDNLVIACRGACNSDQNIFHNPVLRDELLDKVLCKNKL